MSKSDWERQALGSIADGLADRDPTLASKLDIFSRLASGEEMPRREKIQALRAAGSPPPRPAAPARGRVHRQARRLYLRLGAQRAMLLLWVIISVGLISAALALSAGGHRTCAQSMGIVCTGPATGPTLHADQRARTHEGGWVSHHPASGG